MPIPFLQTLPKRARLAYPIIQSGVRQGLASRKISELLQEYGVGIRRATLLDIMRREREIVQHGLNLKFLPLDRTPKPERLPEALTKIRRQYSYTVELRGRVLDTQELITRQVTVASSRLISRRRAEELALAAVLERQDAYGIEVDETQLINVLRAGPAGTLL